MIKMGKKDSMSKQFSRNFLLRNLKEENVDKEVYLTFKFIVHKDEIRKFKEG